MPLDIIKATNMAPTRSSIHVVAGPPGLGKSWFCGTVAEVVPPEEVLLIATLGREVKSIQYQRHDFDTILIEDDEWEPSRKSYKATGCTKLISLLTELREDDKYAAIILDSGTEAGEMAWHEALSPFNVSDPSEMAESNRFLPYTKTGDLMDQIIRSMAKLAGHPSGGKNNVKRTKFVLMTWHVQPPKEKVGSGESADEKGEGVEYEGSVLPMIRGAFRRKLGQYVDSFVYVDRIAEVNKTTARTEMRHVLQVRSDLSKHCKFPGILPDGVNYIDNNFKAYMDLVDKGLENLKNG